MNPIDPMTPVRALIEAHKSVMRHENYDSAFHAKKNKLEASVDQAIPSLSQLLSEHDKVVALIYELRELGAIGSSMPEDMGPRQRAATKVYNSCADRLKSIVEGK